MRIPAGGSAGAAGLCSCAGTAQREQNPAEDAQTTRQGHHTATATLFFFYFFFFLNLVSKKGLKESQICGTIRDPPHTHTNYHYSYLKGTSALSEPSECSAHSSRLPSKGIDLGDASLSMEREGICALQ